MKKILFVLLIFFNLGFAKSLTFNQLITRMSHKFKKINSLKVEYNGSVYSVDSDEPKDFRGEIIFKKPNKYRLKYNNLVTICDGKGVYKLNFTSSQVILTSYDPKKDYVNPLSIIKSIKTKYKKIAFKKNKKKYFVTLKGKEGSDYIDSLMLVISRKTLMPKEFVVVDNLGNKTQYELKNIEKNLKVKSSFFKYHENDTLELFDLRKK